MLCTPGGSQGAVIALNKETGATKALADALVAFASDPAVLATTGKADWWVAQGEMNVNKANDFAMPSF